MGVTLRLAGLGWAHRLRWSRPPVSVGKALSALSSPFHPLIFASLLDWGWERVTFLIPFVYTEIQLVHPEKSSKNASFLPLHCQFGALGLPGGRGFVCCSSCARSAWYPCELVFLYFQGVSVCGSHDSSWCLGGRERVESF